MSDDQNNDELKEVEALEVNNKGLTMGGLAELCRTDPDQAKQVISNTFSNIGGVFTGIVPIIEAFTQGNMVSMARKLKDIKELPQALLKIAIIADIMEEPKWADLLEQHGDNFIDEILESDDPDDKAFMLELAEEMERRYNELVSDPGDKTELVLAKKAKDMPIPTDKANMDIFNPFKYEQKLNGQFAFLFENASDKEKKKGITARATYSLQADSDLLKELGLTDRLTAYDERVCGAVAAMFNAGNEIMTLSQIYGAMGNEGRPNTKQLEKIDKSLQKMRVTILSMNFDNERAAHKDKDLINYNSSFLPYEQVRRTINGRLAEAAIHIFREPPIITAAKQRKQVTTVPIKLLVSKLSQTPENIAIQTLLLKRIARMKNTRTNGANKIRYAYVFEELQTKRNQSRVIDKIHTYLQEFKENGYIKAFKESEKGSGDPGVEITF